MAMQFLNYSPLPLWKHRGFLEARREATAEELASIEREIESLSRDDTPLPQEGVEPSQPKGALSGE